MDTLEELEVLALVAKLTSEIQNYTGISDKTLAEFVLDIHAKVTDNGKKDSKDEFRQSLDEVGADFPSDFVDSIDRTIRQLHPIYRKNQPAENSNSEDKPELSPSGLSQSREKFGGLAIPDNPDHLKKLRELSPSPPPDRKQAPWERRRERERERDDRGRGREQEERGRGRERERIKDQSGDLEEPVVNEIYDAQIMNITHYGAFARLAGFRRPVEGLIHISNIRAGARLDHPGDVLHKFDDVKVKVTKIDGKRISLSMKDVDQHTGIDLSAADRYDPSTSAAQPSYQNGGQKRKKRLTSPERWEIRQLIASGAISAKDYPELDEDVRSANYAEPDELEPEEDIDIEVKDEEPPFLAGQTKHSLELSPIRIVKAPDGSLNRAAANSATMARDRREQRQQEAKEREAKAQAQRRQQTTNDPLTASKSGAGTTDVPPDMPEWKLASTRGKPVTYGKRTSLSLDEQRRSLPVYDFRQQFLDAVRDNQIIIVVGDTGSGKTTQLTQYLVEEGMEYGRKVACTQPRRVAAMSVAKRVAEEFGSKVGQEVGYTVRFDDCTSPRTKIKYMTDGMLQREALLDPDMSQYSVIMLDEAHERTIATDILFALLKKAATRRPDLKLIVTSATLDAEKFSEYFLNCPILYIPGRTYPVDIMYTKEPEMDYLDAALMTVLQIHLSEPPGDILLFLTGQEEIDTSAETLYERMKSLGPDVPELIILPVYSALPSEMQTRIFDPAPKGSRKVVIATNIAETSITIDGIYYVVDPGFVKINAYDPRLGMDTLVISPISQAQANQRAGRAGRTGPGKCYRLYTESAYKNEMLPNTVPDIQRQNLSHTILMLKAMGINDLLNFDFMDPPPTNTMLTALEELYQLSALDREGLLTRLGRKMADFPMEPAMAKVLIASVEAGCAQEILTIVAMLSVQSIFYRPREKQNQADQKKAKFHDSHGDHLTLLNVYNGWIRSGMSKAWCTDNFIHERSMRRAKDVREQLVNIMARYKHAIRSCGNATDTVRKVLCSGYFRNAARKDPQEGYKTLIEHTAVSLHPSSALWGKPAEYVIYHTLLLTTKEYMQCTTVIEPKWLAEAAPTFYKVADSRRMSKRKRHEKIEPLFNRYATDKDDWRLSAQKKHMVQPLETFGPQTT